MDSEGTTWGATLRIRVTIVVTLPLPRAFRIRITMGDEQLVTFTFERLLNFCYLCGRLGHIDKFCDKRYEEGFQDPGNDTPYGPWLRAPIPNKPRPRTSARPSTVRSSTTGSTRCGSLKKGPDIFGNFGVPAQDDNQGGVNHSSTRSEQVEESSLYSSKDPTVEPHIQNGETDVMVIDGNTKDKHIANLLGALTDLPPPPMEERKGANGPFLDDPLDVVPNQQALAGTELVNIPTRNYQGRQSQ
ncbi:UNVERIFIED_CONTAM: hypothetical protein Sradi_0492600 [Sesamum radiatum]|uniref:CCHC-type domain-containing protein n=1 Tax=Sesamum radiatum TaxID=300843 RepID=A0AAW2W7J3_SESRA